MWLNKLNSGTFKFIDPTGILFSKVTNLFHSENYNYVEFIYDSNVYNEIFNSIINYTDIQIDANSGTTHTYYNLDNKSLLLQPSSPTLKTKLNNIDYGEITLSYGNTDYQNLKGGLCVWYDEENQYAQLFYIYVIKYSQNYMQLQIKQMYNLVDTIHNNMYGWFLGTLPIEYNYVPINYIVGNNKTLKLSMIKSESTANGETVMNGELSDIQRFTDTTDLYEIAKRMSVGQEVNLGYTSDNNYVTLTLTSTSTMAQGETAYYTTLKYYLRGLHQATLDCELPYMYITEPNEVYYKLYYTLLLDTEHSACRQSVIAVSKTSDVPPNYIFNLIENTRNLNSDSVQSLMFTWLADGYSLTDTNDPYDYGGTSDSDTGNGTWDNSSEDIDIPSIPSVSISDTGFVSVFNPTLTQVKALADYMWSGAFDVSLFKKVMANPMDSIIGFALIPCEPTVSGVDTVKVGNIDTGVSMNAVANQFVDVDCGLLELQEYWGNYLDYSPYTKITLILPFIGAVHLNPDDCMNKTIGIKYRIDILSGGCVAYITCNGSVMYQFTGSCSAQLPITNLDYRGMISALVSIGTTAVGVGSAIASGGITAPMVAVGVGNTANNVMNGKPNIQHGGSLGSTSGFLGTRIPYLIITRPRQCVPTNVNKFKGLPSLITSKLKNVTGFTQVHDIHLDLLPCSDEEKLELKGLLESGVII